MVEYDQLEFQTQELENQSLLTACRSEMIFSPNCEQKGDNPEANINILIPQMKNDDLSAPEDSDYEPESSSSEDMIETTPGNLLHNVKH